jgi:hypothetical protein
VCKNHTLRVESHCACKNQCFACSNHTLACWNNMYACRNHTCECRIHTHACLIYSRVRRKHTLRVKSHSACGNFTLSVETNLGRVIIKLVRVEIRNHIRACRNC